MKRRVPIGVPLPTRNRTSPNAVVDEVRFIVMSPSPHPTDFLSSPRPANQASIWFRIRFACYFGLVAGIFQGLVILIPQYSYAAVVPESHGLEFTQMGILALAAIGFVVLAVRKPEARDLYILLMTLALFGVLRENNNTEIYQRILHQKWMKWVLALGVLGLLATTMRRQLFVEIRALLLRRSILLFIAGAIVVTAWAQVLSSDRIWENQADRLVEEALELAGYFLILCGVVEEFIATKTHKEGV